MGEHSDSARLAGEMHTTEWALCNLAADVSADRDQPEHLEVVAERLEQIAQVLRLRAGTRQIGEALEQQP